MRADSPIECSQHHRELDLASVAEKSKHIATKGELVINGRETAPLVIPKELPKHIDPSLRPNKSDIAEANVNRSEELGPSMRDDEASTDTDMQSEQGGEFSLTIAFPFSRFCLSMNMLIWNCQGALNPNFCEIVNEMVRLHSPAIMVVVETKVCGERAKRISEKLDFDGVIIANSIGLTGGLWVL